MGSYWSVFYNSKEKVALVFELSWRGWADDVNILNLEKPEGIKEFFKEKIQQYDRLQKAGYFYLSSPEEILRRVRRDQLIYLAKEIMDLSKMEELLEAIFPYSEPINALIFWVSSGWHYYFKENGWEIYVKWIEEFEALERYIQEKEKDGWRVLLFRRIKKWAPEKPKKYDFDIGEAETPPGERIKQEERR